MEYFKLSLVFVTPDAVSEENCQQLPSMEDALEEADDIAFSTVGYPLEDWDFVDFGEGNQLYYFYPNEVDKTSRYKLTILKEDI